MPIQANRCVQMPLRPALQILCTFALSTLLLATASAGLVNGTFEQVDAGAFVGWDAKGLVEIGSDASGNFAILRDVDPLSNDVESLLVQEIQIPSDSISFSFDFAFSVNGNLISIVEDTFDATIFIGDGLTPFGDESISPVFAGIPPFFPPVPAFFAAGGGGFELGSGVSTSDVGSGLRIGWTRVTLELRSGAAQEARIEFALLDAFFVSADADALVDNVVLRSGPGAVIPEPASAVTWAIAMLSSLSIGLRRQRGP